MRWETTYEPKIEATGVFRKFSSPGCVCCRSGPMSLVADHVPIMQDLAGESLANKGKW